MALKSPLKDYIYSSKKGYEVLNKVCESKGVPFVNRRYAKRGTFVVRNGIEGVKGWTSGRSLPV